MNRSLTTVAVLTFLAVATPLFALDPVKTDAPAATRDRTTVIDDVIRMSNAGVSDDAIIKFIRQSRDQYVVDADVIIALTDARVSKPVLDAVMDEAYEVGDRNYRRDDQRNEGKQRATTVYVRPAYPYYDPWYSPWWYDPFWYGPRLSIGFGFGGFHGGGHHVGGHGGHGRHH
jgi:hypothetical protein